ncbi:MAG: lectin-like protein, partial [Bdellovibrionota bacterium]|nr:lectin-like protein [Bdellovibrionota bacterium]
KFLRFYDGEKETGKITPSILKEAIECNIPGLEVDWLTVDHAKAFIWTWADGEPKKWGQGQNCAAITQNGRWVATDCKEKLPFACQDEKNKGFWIVTRGRGAFKEGREACQKERYQFKFNHPKNGWENARIYKNNKFKKAWISLKK